jgi:hypothetical protein
VRQLASGQRAPGAGAVDTEHGILARSLDGEFLLFQVEPEDRPRIVRVADAHSEEVADGVGRPLGWLVSGGFAAWHKRSGAAVLQVVRRVHESSPRWSAVWEFTKPLRARSSFVSVTPDGSSLLRRDYSYALTRYYLEDIGTTEETELPELRSIVSAYFAWIREE